MNREYLIDEAIHSLKYIKEEECSEETWERIQAAITDLQTGASSTTLLTEFEELEQKVKELTLTIAEKEAIIEALQEDLKYYKRNFRNPIEIHQQLSLDTVKLRGEDRATWEFNKPQGEEEN